MTDTPKGTRGALNETDRRLMESFRRAAQKEIERLKDRIQVLAGHSNCYCEKCKVASETWSPLLESPLKSAERLVEALRFCATADEVNEETGEMESTGQRCELVAERARTALAAWERGK